MTGDAAKAPADTGWRTHARILRGGTPGQRFVDYHDWRAARPRGLGMRVVRVALAAVCLPAGLIMLVTPGPGILALLAALGLLAQESRAVARMLDATERGGRQLIGR